MFSELGDQFGMGWSRGLLAWVRYNEGNFEEAEALAELAIGGRDSDKWAHGMMLVLLANLRLWRGRGKAALPLANEARALFQSIGDHYGRAMALAAASRSLAAVGDVAEVKGTRRGHGRRRPYCFGEDGREHCRRRVPDLGDGDRASTSSIAAETIRRKPGARRPRVDGEHRPRLPPGREKVDEALTLLEGAAEQSPTARTPAERVRAASAAIGEPENAIGLADAAESFSGASYLDHNTAGAARVLALAKMGDESAARKALDAATAFIDSTDDQLARRVTRLAGAEALACLGDESAGELRTTTQAELIAMGSACRRLDDGLPPRCARTWCRRRRRVADHRPDRGAVLPAPPRPQLMIEAAAAQVDRLVVMVNTRDGEPVPGELRAEWLAELHPDVAVVEVRHDLRTDFDDQELWAAVDGPVPVPLAARR